MKITDEILSAFLDAELPAAEMDAVREALALEETLVERLAELALVDQVVADAYGRIDELPLPSAVQKLIAESPPRRGARQQAQTSRTATEGGGNVIRFPGRGRKGRSAMPGWGQSLAAGVVLAVALGVVFNLVPSTGDRWPAIAAVLDTAPSGEEQAIAGDGAIKPRISFINDEGQYCRLYRHRLDSSRVRDAVACHRDGQWQQVDISNTRLAPVGGPYRTAAGGEADALLDAHIVGEPLDGPGEQRAIALGWRVDKVSDSIKEEQSQ